MDYQKGLISIIVPICDYSPQLNWGAFWDNPELCSPRVKILSAAFLSLSRDKLQQGQL